MSEEKVNINEWLLRCANRSTRNKISKLFNAIMIKSQSERKTFAIVIKDTNKLAPSIFLYVKNHPECKYFRIGPSYNQKALAAEIYMEVIGERHRNFAMIPDVLREIASF